MADGFTYYTENAGLPSLRKSLARYYQELHGVELDPTSEITVTASGVQALSVGLRCMVDPGDEALVLTPSWPNGPSIIQMSHGVVKEIPQPLIGDRYEIDFDALERAVTPRTQAAALHLAVESPGVGRDREGSGKTSRLHPPSRLVADGGRGL